MIDPKQAESVINKSDMVLNVLKKRCKLEFKLGAVRVKVAFLGWQYVYNGLERDNLVTELMNLGFDNLTLTQIVETFVFLHKKVYELKNSPRRETDPVRLAASRIKVEANIKRNVQRGKY